MNDVSQHFCNRSLHQISVSGMLRDINTVTVMKSRQVSHALEIRSLGIVSPEKMESKSGRLKREPSQKKEEQNQGTKSLAPEADGLPPPFSSGASGAPARRIRRPTSIRRPKLIGKSVEGAALQAVAASRKRASSNQFKSRTGPPLAAKGGRGSALRDLPKAQGAGGGMTRGTIRSTERQTIALRQPSKQHDQKLSRLRMDYFNLLAERSQQACRQSSLYQSSRLRLASIWWPRDLQQRIPASVANFLLSTAPKVWNDTCALPPLPGGIAPLFIPTFARWVAALSTGLELVSFPASSTLPSGILLCSTVRNVRGTKCCVVVRISLMKTLLSRPSSTAVMSEGWILSLPRRAASSQKRKEDTNVRSSALTTKDSVGMDVLATEIHVSCVASQRLLDRRKCMFSPSSECSARLD